MANDPITVSLNASFDELYEVSRRLCEQILPKREYPVIDWQAFNEINNLTKNSLMKGESDKLQRMEIDIINLRLQTALSLLKDVDRTFTEARDRFAGRYPEGRKPLPPLE